MYNSATGSVGLPLPAWGEGGGEGVTGLSRDQNPSPHPSPFGSYGIHTSC